MPLGVQYSHAKTSVEFIDTHCHIHEAGLEMAGDDPARAAWLRHGKKDPDQIIQAATASGVTRLICVGTTCEDSQLAIDFVQQRSNCWASIGIHPHEAGPSLQGKTLEEFSTLVEKPKVVAVGECGLDYYYEHSTKAHQKQVLIFQLELAKRHNLPLIFHIREAFDDFWPIFDQYKGVRGVVHSFSSDMADLEQILVRGLYVGLNGIMTFTSIAEQLLAAKAIPLSNLLLETDAPFLTPAPYRGTICEPKHVSVTAEFLSGLRGEALATIAQATTQNATNLFGTV